MEVPKLKKRKLPTGDIQWITPDDRMGIDWSPHGNIITILVNPFKGMNEGGAVRTVQNPLFNRAANAKEAEFKAYMLLSPILFEVDDDDEAQAAYQAVRDKFGMDERA